MKKLCYVISVLTFAFLCLLNTSSKAQESTNKRHKGSIQHVSDDYKLHVRLVWRRMDLEEKKNSPFFARGSELPRVIINAVKSGLLIPYENDSLVTRMTKEKFLENLKYEEEDSGLSKEEIEMGFGSDNDEAWGGDADASESEEAPQEANEFDARDFSIVEIKEEAFFDRMRSVMDYDILALTLYLPAKNNPALFEKPLASFSYADLTKLFKAMPDVAIWYNAQNVVEHRNMSDAFKLRLFDSMLVKYGNPDDKTIADIYSKSRKAGILASLQVEYDMIDFENELWSY